MKRRFITQSDFIKKSIDEFNRPVYCRLCGREIIWFSSSSVEPGISIEQYEWEKKFKVHLECVRAKGVSLPFC